MVNCGRTRLSRKGFEVKAMSNVKHFTIEDVAKFVFSKDDNKEINFYRTINNERCGCLMVQMGQENGIVFYCAGISELVTKIDGAITATFEFPYSSYYNTANEVWPNTYGEVKKWFRYKHWEVVEKLGL